MKKLLLLSAIVCSVACKGNLKNTLVITFISPEEMIKESQKYEGEWPFPKDKKGIIEARDNFVREYAQALADYTPVGDYYIDVTSIDVKNNTYKIGFSDDLVVFCGFNDYICTHLSEPRQWSQWIIDIVIPDSVIEVDADAFASPMCEELKSVTIPNSVDRIGKSAFSGCRSLVNVSIPDSVKEIGNEAFWFCDSMHIIKLSNSITEISDGTFKFCKKIKSIKIPELVERIGDNAFGSCSSLQSVELPNSLMDIGDNAFASTALKDVIIPDSVTTIGKGAFLSCASLQNIKLSNSLTEIDLACFACCSSLNNSNNFVIPKSVKYIGFRAFADCTSLRHVSVPKRAYIDADAFMGSRVVLGYYN